MATRRASLNGNDLGEGDGAALCGERSIERVGEPDAEVLVFDLA